MVLFLCLNNYSYSEIALLLNEFGYKITPVRVNDYLEQLKLIFNVRNKQLLIEKAIGLNFHVCLPEGLFNKLCSLEIKDYVTRNEWKWQIIQLLRVNCILQKYLLLLKYVGTTVLYTKAK